MDGSLEWTRSRLSLVAYNTMLVKDIITWGPFLKIPGNFSGPKANF